MAAHRRRRGAKSQRGGSCAHHEIRQVPLPAPSAELSRREARRLPTRCTRRRACGPQTWELLLLQQGSDDLRARRLRQIRAQVNSERAAILVLARNPITHEGVAGHLGAARRVATGAPVVMVESGEHRDCVNASLGLRWTGNGLLVRESLVRASLVVETHVLGNDASKVFLAEDEDVIEQLSSERAGQALSEGIHVRRAYRGRTTRAPDDLNTSAKRALSFVSWSQTSTSGAPSMVAFLACCAHHPAVGPYVTAAWMILRRRRSRKKSTKTSRNRMSYVWTNSHAHVTWLRRNVDQPWPSPGGRERRMYRWTVRLQTRTPSLSNSPRMRSAPQRGLRV